MQLSKQWQSRVIWIIGVSAILVTHNVDVTSILAAVIGIALLSISVEVGTPDADSTAD